MKALLIALLVSFVSVAAQAGSFSGYLFVDPNSNNCRVTEGERAESIKCVVTNNGAASNITINFADLGLSDFPVCVFSPVLRAEAPRIPNVMVERFSTTELVLGSIDGKNIVTGSIGTFICSTDE